MRDRARLDGQSSEGVDADWALVTTPRAGGRGCGFAAATVADAWTGHDKSGLGTGSLVIHGEGLGFAV